MQGRRPKPTAIKDLAGNPGKRPLNNQEPKPGKLTRTPPVPGHIRGVARQEWRRMAKTLNQLGLLTEIDLPALEMYCQMYGRWVEAEERVRDMGMIVKTNNGNPIQNPYLAVANRAAKDMKSMLVEFGMTPSSRSRVQVDTGPDEVDEYEQFVNARSTGSTAKLYKMPERTGT